MGVIPISICVGCGLTVDGSGVLNVLPRPGGGISCQNTGAADDGIYVNFPSTAVNHTDGSCVTLTGDGSGGSPLHPEIRLGGSPNGLLCGGDGLRVDRSEDACNGIQIRANGLYAPCPNSIVNSMNVSPAFTPFGINSAGAGTFAVLSGCNSSCNGGYWHICNTLCCAVAGFISCRVYAGVVSGASLGFDAAVHIEISINGAGFTGASPPTYTRMSNLAGNQTYWDLANMEERNLLVLNPNECVDIQLQAVVNVFAGTATWSGGPNFEYYVHLTQTGCC